MSDHDKKIADGVKELQKAMQDLAATIQQCADMQKQVAEVVNLIVAANLQLYERIGAIEAKLERDEQYQQEQNER